MFKRRWAVVAGVTAIVALSGVAHTQSPTDLPRHPSVNAFYRAFTTKDLSLLDQALSEAWIDVPLAPGQGPGREGFKPAAESFFQAFPDITARIEQVVADGNTVAVRATLSGTHRGAFAGAAGTIRRFEIQAIDIHEIGPDGLIARTWHTEDWLTALHQLGILPVRNAGAGQ